jgi:uncharacterized protein
MTTTITAKTTASAHPKTSSLALPFPKVARVTLATSVHSAAGRRRIMVQIQSTWFPLYDRNSQTFAPNIFWAKPGDFRKATQRIYHTPGQATFFELPLVTTP